MRKIKFRGKTSSGKWIYGDLMHYPNKDIAIYPLDDEEPADVAQETVSQFCGYDSEGNGIYEGDIVEYEGKHKFIVRYDDYENAFLMFRFDGRKSPVQFHKAAYKKLKVVGNIFDKQGCVN